MGICGKLLCDIYFCFFFTTRKRDPQFTLNLLCMRGLIPIHTITHFILCDYIFVAPVDYVWVNIHLKIRLHNRGLSLKKDCVMNMRDLRHEYEGYVS